MGVKPRKGIIKKKAKPCFIPPASPTAAAIEKNLPG